MDLDELAPAPDDVYSAAVAAYIDSPGNLGSPETLRAAINYAYRAGRADAASAVSAEADDESRRPNRDDNSRLIEKWLREAAEIAGGIR